MVEKCSGLLSKDRPVRKGLAVVAGLAHGFVCGRPLLQKARPAAGCALLVFTWLFINKKMETRFGSPFFYNNQIFITRT